MLDDNGTLIVDSHAIMAYLVEKYADSDQLYPKDLVKRAKVDARMHFDSGHVFCRLRMLCEPVLYEKATELPEEKIEYIQRAWEIINHYVENTSYVCGDEMTIADFSLVATTASLTDLAPIDPDKYGAIFDWINRMSQLPYYEEINAGGARGM